MIMTVTELRSYIQTDLEDSVLKAKLSALELLIRKYTNNNFQRRAFRRNTDVVGSVFIADKIVPFEVGDTLQISQSEFNDGLVTVKEVSNTTFTVNEHVYDDRNAVVTKVVYPDDVKLGVVNMLQWDIENRKNVGVQSETLSRHSVTYFNMDGDNSMVGYPKSLTGFLKPYMVARF